MYSKIIAGIRQACGMTQSELANKLNVDPTLISKWEKGEREPGKNHIAPLLNLATPEQQAALLRALLNDDNLEILVYEETPDGGLVLRRITDKDDGGQAGSDAG